MEKELKLFSEEVGVVTTTGHVHFNNKQGFVNYLNEFVWYREGGAATLFLEYAGFGGYKEVWEVKTGFYRIVSDNYSDANPQVEWTRMDDMPPTVYEHDQDFYGVRVTELF